MSGRISDLVVCLDTFHRSTSAPFQVVIETISIKHSYIKKRQQ